jgi:hypothetical protein
MPRDAKVYLVRLLFWATAIFIIARPLRTVRPEMGDTAYVVGSLVVLVACHVLGKLIAERAIKTDRHAARVTPLRPLKHRVWTALFRASGLVLVCCMVAIVGFPYTVGYTWVYWVALGSAAVCGVSAVVLEKRDSEEASGDAAWLLGYRERGGKERWDIDVDD